MNEAVNLSGQIAVESTEHGAGTELYNFCNLGRGAQLSPFNLIRFVVHPGCQSDLDQHKVKEYWYISAGEGLLEIAGKEVPALAGSLFFFESMVTHRIKNLSATADLEILSAWW